MSYFGNALAELLNRKNMKAVRLAELTGVGQPTISRYINGDQTWVGPEDLDMLASGISENPAEQAELIRAHLLDECHGPGSQLIEISVSGQPVREQQTSYRVKLPKELEEALATIREYVIKDKNVRDVVEGLGNLLRTGDVRTFQERGGKSSSESDADRARNLQGDIVDILEDTSSQKKKRGGRQK